MIVLEFFRNGVKYTSVIHSNWVGFFVFLVVLSGGLAIKLFRRKKRKFAESMPNPKGGTLIPDCIDPEKAYELVNGAVKLAFRQQFQEDGATVGTPVIITTGVFFIVTFYSYLISKRSLNSILVAGVKMYALNSLDVVLKILVGAGTASGILILLGTTAIISIIGTISLSIALLLAISNHVDCSDYVIELLQSTIQTVKKDRPPETVVFMDEPQNRLKDRVFILPSEQSKIYVPQKVKYDVCSEEMTEAYLEIENVNPVIPWKKDTTKLVRRQCSSDKTYGPLKARTKTISDLEKDEVSKLKGATDLYLQQTNRKTSRNERIKND